MSTRVLAAFVAVGALGSAAVRLEAQSGISITSPAAGARLAAGPDYATDVLGDPWDMNNLDDISKDPGEHAGWSSFGMANGLLGGTINHPDATTTFLYRGFYGIVNPVRSGLRYPIDPNRYRKIAFKMRSTAASQNVQVYWFHRPLGDPAGLGLGVRFVGATDGGEKIHVADLTQSLASGEAWTSALVRGLRVDPNSGATGQEVYFDWVRLTAGDGASGAAMHTITWSGGSGSTTIEVIDAGGTVMPVASGLSGTSYSWNYGVLPPGSYTLRIRNSGGTATRAFSVNAPPIVHVTDPDETGGDDYATDVLGNPWDMNDPADVQYTANVSSKSFSSGFFHGTSNSSGDPSVYLLGPSNNSVPIDTSKYRYLTFDLQVDGAYDLARGSVARIFWGSQSYVDASTMTTTKDIIVWPGTNRFTIDLSKLSVTATGGLESSGARQIWTAAQVRHLRIDPHEFPEPRQFHIGRVRLTAPDDTTSTFRIQYAGWDGDNDAASVSLYYDTNTNPDDGKTLIRSGLPLSASGAFDWSVGAVPAGTYYIYALASDGIDTHGSYSTGPIVVNSGGGGPGPTAGLMNIDVPTDGVTVPSTFTMAGWAIDRGAPSGPGVDAVHVYAYLNPGSGTAPKFVGAAAYGSSRSDIGAAFGSQFTNSGFSLSISGLAAGTYQLVAYGRSTVTGTFNITDAVTVKVPAASTTPMPRMSLDSPIHGAVVNQPFQVAGWAIDAGAASGTGVDAVHIWAFPNPGSGAPAKFLGVASYGISRPDVAAALGSRYQHSGFALLVAGLAPGTHQIVAYAHSTVTGTFNNSKSAVIHISHPLMTIDSPVPGSTLRQPFALAGWAIDTGASTGTGVDAVHVWAYPVAGGSPRFVGIAAYGATRSDVGSMFGSRFSPSGYNVVSTALPAGTYDIAVFARSTVTGTFNNSRVVRVTVQ